MRNKINAFVGHSFSPNDEKVVNNFVDFFNTIKDSKIDFNWERAKAAEPKDLFDKVREKMKDKNLFIGICTRKELVINEDDLKKPFFEIFRKGYLNSKADNYEIKTSDWLLQEIGYALGKEMSIILLVEEGIRNPGEFQGNLEKIYFSRENPEKTFDQIIQMIGSLAPKEEIEISEQIQRETPSKEKAVEEKLDRFEEWDQLYEGPKEDWTEIDYESSLSHFIWRRNDDKEELINESFLSKCKDEKKRIKWEGFRLYLKEIYQKENNLEKLKSIEKSHPDIPEIKLYLARLYNKYEDRDKAAEYFAKASELFEDEFDRLIYFCESAKINAINGKINQSLILFEKAKSLIKGIDDRQIYLLTELQDLAKTTKHFNEYLACGEHILSLKPDDHSARFNLAYQYLELEQNDIALFHFKILTEKNPMAASWNNLGVVQKKLGLKGRAVDSYVVSQDSGGTIAMNNLAQLYMVEGFYNAANEICEKATKIDGYAKRIGGTISEISDKNEEESKNEKEAIEKTRSKRTFGIKFGFACVDATPSQLSGVWIGSQCPLKITIDKNSFLAEGEHEKEIANPLSKLFSLGTALTVQKTTTKIKIKIKYYGEVLGRAIRFKMSSSGERASVLGGSPDDEGLMVISEGFNEIQVYEKNKKDSENFYFLKKLESSE